MTADPVWPPEAREAVARALNYGVPLHLHPEAALAALAPFLAAALAAQAGAMRDRCARAAMVEVGWNTGTKEARKAVAFQAAHTVNAIRALSIPHADALAAARAVQAEEAMDSGATKAIELLAKWLGVAQWEGGDGTETWDGDVSVEIGNVLKAAGVYEDENGTVATHAALAEARKAGLREAAAKVRVHAAAAKQCSDESDVIHRIRAEYLAKAFALNAAADDIEAAILALAEEAGE